MADGEAGDACAVCGGERAEFKCPCETAFYCGKACQKIDWDRGHREVCKEIRAERKKEAAKRSEASTREPLVFYGPEERTDVDDARDRVKAEHEAARAWREANPEPEPLSARFGSRCPICLDAWDVNAEGFATYTCCMRAVCVSCFSDKKRSFDVDSCPLCLTPKAKSDEERLARLWRHVENDIPEALHLLAHAYFNGTDGMEKSYDQGVRMLERAAQMGHVQAMFILGDYMYDGMLLPVAQKKATQFLTDAADRGYARAQTKLGKWLMSTDPDSAAHWFGLAAAQGYTDAQLHLCLMCAVPYNKPRNFDEAKRLYPILVAKRDQITKEALDTIKTALEQCFKIKTAKLSSIKSDIKSLPRSEQTYERLAEICCDAIDVLSLDIPPPREEPALRELTNVAPKQRRGKKTRPRKKGPTS